MFLKKEKPMDDFYEKIPGSKEKYFKSFNILKNVQVLTDTLAKISQNFFAYSFVSETFFFILRKKTCIL